MIIYPKVILIMTKKYSYICNINWIKLLWKTDKSYFIAVLVGLFLLIMFALFNKQINKLLTNKQEWWLFSPLWERDYSTLFKHNINNNNNSNGSRGELKSREIFERLFNKPFMKIRPNWLKRNTTGRNMELDGYNDELKLAFEYNGIQHAQFSPYFHKNINDSIAQKIRDLEKQQLCEKMGVKLIMIPHTIPINKLEKYIKEELQRAKINY